MSAALKAIETVYRGYRFRSRLEARWAVFFDVLEIAWEYEPQGYTLPSGERYLPDFFLPQLSGGLYAEVKPSTSNDCEQFDKATQFAAIAPHGALLLDGPPDFRTYYLACNEAQGLVTVHFCDGRLFYEGGNLIEPVEPMHCGRNVISAVHAARSARFEFGENACAG